MIIVHIGQPKTGTSVLQSALSNFSSPTNAFCYPPEFRDRKTAHHAFAIGLRTSADPDEFCKEASAMLVPATDHDMVISSEQFFNLLSHANLPRLVKFLEICAARSETMAVLYLRRWDDFVNSMFLQSVRHGRVQPDPEAYATKHLHSVFGIFAAIDALGQKDGFDLRVFAYNPKVDIRRHFESLMPSIEGLSEVTGLPRTEKLTLKQQVSISFVEALMEEPLGNEIMNRMVAHVRKGALRFADDQIDYCVIPPELDEQLRTTALQAARTNRLESYIEAFSGAAPVKNYRAYDASVLTAEDVAMVRALVDAIRKNQRT